VFQIATHVDAVPLDTLYRWCAAAREILQGEHAVARVIARPFTGRPGDFRRLGGKRRDYSLSPPHPTVLNALAAAGKAVIGVGKIPDIYNRSGITKEVKSGSNAEGIDRTLELMREQPDGLVFTNLVDFDSLYGHRRDTRGYARALAETDARIPDLMEATGDKDVLLFVSDHGNDPTWYGTDHTREYGLLLAYAPGLQPQDLGTRESFADVGATVAELLGVPWDGAGQSFAELLTHRAMHTPQSSSA
jgi:phosphopentomutase